MILDIGYTGDMKRLTKLNVSLLGSGIDFTDFDCRMGAASGCRKTGSRRVQTRGNGGNRSTVSVTSVSHLMILIETSETKVRGL